MIFRLDNGAWPHEERMMEVSACSLICDIPAVFCPYSAEAETTVLVRFLNLGVLSDDCAGEGGEGPPPPFSDACHLGPIGVLSFRNGGCLP